MKNTREEEEEEELNYPKLQHGKKNPKTNLKTTKKLLSLCSGNPRAFIGKTRHLGTHTELHVKSWRAAPQGSRENATMAVFSRP